MNIFKKIKIVFLSAMLICQVSNAFGFEGSFSSKLQTEEEPEAIGVGSGTSSSSYQEEAPPSANQSIESKPTVVEQLDKVIAILNDPKNGYASAMIKNHKMHVNRYFELLRLDLVTHTQYVYIVLDELAAIEAALINRGEELEALWQRHSDLKNPKIDIPQLIVVAQMLSKLESDFQSLDQIRQDAKFDLLAVDKASKSFCADERLLNVYDMFDISRMFQRNSFTVARMSAVMGDVFSDMAGQRNQELFDEMYEHIKHAYPDWAISFGIGTEGADDDGSGGRTTFSSKVVLEKHQKSWMEKATAVLLFLSSPLGKAILTQVVTTVATSLGYSAAIAVSEVMAIISTGVNWISLTLAVFMTGVMIHDIIEYINEENRIHNRVNEMVRILHESLPDSNESRDLVKQYCGEGLKAATLSDFWQRTETLRADLINALDGSASSNKRLYLQHWSSNVWTSLISLFSEIPEIDLHQTRDLLRNSFVQQEQLLGLESSFFMQGRQRTQKVMISREVDQNSSYSMATMDALHRENEIQLFDVQFEIMREMPTMSSQSIDLGETMKKLMRDREIRKGAINE